MALACVAQDVGRGGGGIATKGDHLTFIDGHCKDCCSRGYVAEDIFSTAVKGEAEPVLFGAIPITVLWIKRVYVFYLGVFITSDSQCAVSGVLYIYLECV